MSSESMADQTSDRLGLFIRDKYGNWDVNEQDWNAMFDSVKGIGSTRLNRRNPEHPFVEITLGHIFQCNQQILIDFCNQQLGALPGQVKVTIDEKFCGHVDSCEWSTPMPGCPLVVSLECVQTNPCWHRVRNIDEPSTRQPGGDWFSLMARFATLGFPLPTNCQDLQTTCRECAVLNNTHS